MASSSSSASSGLSFQSSSSRESTPEFEVASMYDAIAPLWWDEADWDFAAQSEDDEPKTDGEDNLQFLVDGELEEESADDAISWGKTSPPRRTRRRRARRTRRPPTSTRP